MEARAADLVGVDECHLHAELRGAEGGRVAPGAGAEHDEIEPVRVVRAARGRLGHRTDGRRNAQPEGVRRLESTLERTEELRAHRAIDQSVIGGQRQLHDLPDLDGTGDDHGRRDRGGDGEDRGFAGIDDRAEFVDPEHAQVGYRERTARQVVDRGTSFARCRGERGSAVVDLRHGQRVRIPDHRHDEPGGHGHGQAEVDPPAGPHRDPVGPGVHVRVLRERVGRGGQDQVRDGQVGARGLELRRGGRAASSRRRRP